MNGFKKKFLAAWDELDECDRPMALDTLLTETETLITAFEALELFVREYAHSKLNELSASEKAAALAPLPDIFFQRYPEFLEQSDQSRGC